MHFTKYRNQKQKTQKSENSTMTAIPYTIRWNHSLAWHHLEEVVAVKRAPDERRHLGPHPEDVPYRGVDHHVHVPLRVGLRTQQGRGGGGSDGGGEMAWSSW